MEEKEKILIFIMKDSTACDTFKEQLEASEFKYQYEIDYINLSFKKNKRYKYNYGIKSVPAFAFLGADKELIAAHTKAVNFDTFKRLICQ